jgi:multidrug efflux system membrane fusion protein
MAAEHIFAKSEFTLHRSFHSWIIPWILSWGVLSLLAACSGETETKAENRTKMAVPVTAALAQQKTVPVQIQAIGTVQAYSTVSIKSLVAGEVTEVHFTEGQNVVKGELLFTIDPRPYKAALQQAQANLTKDLAAVNQAEANLAKDIAQAKNAEEEAKRYAELVAKEYVAKQEYDQYRTAAEALQATVEADRAAVATARAAVQAAQSAVENARIQLDYCFIRSPVDGRTGAVFVQRGNIVKANDVAQVVINQVNPIYVAFSVPEQNLPEIKRYRAQTRLQVEAIIPGEEKSPEQGTLTFVDNAVDKTTGTILLKGTFGNQKRRLWPGQFVNVTLTLTHEANAILIPSQAVQSGQQGPYAYVVKPDMTVESRPLTISRQVGDETVIAKGIRPGERVVTSGQLGLAPGVMVTVEGQKGEKP